jgi:hypothetical protein
MPRKSEQQRLYESVLKDPTATVEQKLTAGQALDKYLKQRQTFKRHGRVKKMLGIGARGRVKELFPEGMRPVGTFICHDRTCDWSTRSKPTRRIRPPCPLSFPLLPPKSFRKASDSANTRTRRKQSWRQAGHVRTAIKAGNAKTARLALCAERRKEKREF